MKQEISQLLATAVDALKADGTLPADLQPKIQLENTRDKSHGDLACNLAMMLAKPAGKKPRDIAEALVANLPDSTSVAKVDIAGPGFINFFLAQGASFQVVNDILQQQENFGRCNEGKGQKVQLEFVSANPTGPLHVGHGRGAAYGASYANMMEAIGFDVEREYYVNDAGRQMDILATSVWLRYLELCDEALTFPSNGYKGDYVRHYAEVMLLHNGKKLQRSATLVFANITLDEPQGGDKEKHIDDLIERCKELLQQDYDIVFNAGLEGILKDIREDLAEFGVEYDQWFSERSLTIPDNLVERAIQKLQDNGHIEEREGALWFLSTRLGDDKDRVVKRENGQTTYFASDIAYHLNKFERGFKKVINIWGADHHGYIARVKAALQALDLNPDDLEIRLVQFVSLYRGDEQIKMSTRSGSFVTLRELREEVSNDAARFFYITRRSEQPMDFDLELATSQSKDNPVYYIQYAHARICSVYRKAAENGYTPDQTMGLENMDLLAEEHESAIATLLNRYPEVLKAAALNGEPHVLANYLKDLASEFHTWYNGHKTLVEDEKLRNARLSLCKSIKQVLFNGLQLLGVSAPESM